MTWQSSYKTVGILVILLQFILLNLLIDNTYQNQNVDHIIQQIRDKHCPKVGFHGPECGGHKRSYEELTDPEHKMSMFSSGVGYDQYKHQVNPQVLQSHAPQSFSNWENNGHLQNTYQNIMSNAKQFYQMIFQDKNAYNGLYSHDPSRAESIFNHHFVGDFKVSDTQKQYFTHACTIKGYDHYKNGGDDFHHLATTEFRQLIQALPEHFDKNTYQKVLNAFGNKISVNTHFGGVVDELVALRSCYSSPKMKKYLQYQLDNDMKNKKVHHLPNGFMNYRKVSKLDVVGGNPEIGNNHIEKRVQTFGQNPVAVQFNLIPIYYAFPKGSKQRAHMKKIVEEYEHANQNDVHKYVHQIQEKEHEKYLGNQELYVYLSETHRCSNPIWYGKQCPHHHLCRKACTYRVKRFQLKAGQAKDFYGYKAYWCARSTLESAGRFFKESEDDTIQLEDENGQPQEYQVLPHPDETELTGGSEDVGIEYDQKQLNATLQEENYVDFAENHCTPVKISLQVARDKHGHFYTRTIIVLRHKPHHVWKVFKSTHHEKSGCNTLMYRNYMLLRKYRRYIDKGLVFRTCSLCTPYVHNDGYKLQCGCRQVD